MLVLITRSAYVDTRGRNDSRVVFLYDRAVRHGLDAVVMRVNLRADLQSEDGSTRCRFRITSTMRGSSVFSSLFRAVPIRDPVKITVLM